MDGTIDDALRSCWRREGHGGALFRVAIRKRATQAQLLSALCQFGDAEIRPRSLRHYVYARMELADLWMSRSNAMSALGLFTAGGTLHFPSLPPFNAPTFRMQSYRIHSGVKHRYVTAHWPMIYVEGAVTGDVGMFTTPSVNERLIGNPGPLYPSEAAAVMNFVHEVHSNERYGWGVPSFVAFGWDKRARIRAIELRGTSLTIRVDHSPKMKCRLYVYGPSVSSGIQERGINVSDGTASVDLVAQPEYLLIGLTNRKLELLDEREVDFTSGRGAEGVSVVAETRELVVRQWIEGGETNRIEFKQDWKAKDNRSTDELLESVVSFANTEGGTIILGVSDHGDIVGFERLDITDVIQQVIHQKCDPIPMVKIEITAVERKPLVLIHVQRGQAGTLFSLDRQKHFVRAGATDRLARTEEIAARLRLPDQGLDTDRLTSAVIARLDREISLSPGLL